MTVLSALQAAAPWIGLAVPDQVYSATNRTAVELQAVAGEAAKQISEEYDWPVLRKLGTIPGDGTAESFALPSDFDRWLKTSQLWSSTNTTIALSHVLDADQWLAMDIQGIDYPYGAWISYGGEVHIKPTLADTATVKFFYARNTIVRASDDSLKAEFTADDDSFVLSERLLRLAIVWMWKAQKGTDYQEDMMNYQVALAQEIAAARGPSAFAVGKGTWPAGVNVAYPYSLGS